MPLLPITETISHGYVGFELTLVDLVLGPYPLLLLLEGRSPLGRFRSRGNGNNIFFAFPFNLGLSFP